MELGGPTSAEIIRRATASTLRRADELGARSLALVAFGTGVGGFPLDEAARIEVEEVRKHLEGGSRLERIVFAVRGGAAREAFVNALGGVTVAYDEDLANRIRELLADEAGIIEKKMFGGLAFLIGGNMAVAASGQGGILLRVDPRAKRRPGRQAPRRPSGDAGPRHGGVAPDRAGGPQDQAPAGALGIPGRRLRQLAAAQGPQRIEKPLKPSGSSSSTSTRCTCGVPGTALKKAQDPLHRLGVALEHRLHRPVGHVARPPGDPVGVCPLAGRVAKEDPLDAAVYLHPPSDRLPWRDFRSRSAGEL